MTFKTMTSLLVAASVALLFSVGAQAAGNHAGGHAHEQDDGQTSYGKPGVASKVSRTIEVVMSDDMRFTPSRVQVRRGETVRFAVKNAGQVRHEFSLGTRQELEEHYEQMKKFPDMVHDEPNKISLEPGKEGEVIWHFNKGGTVDFACLHVGHYEAGMKGQVKVGK